MNFLLGKSEKIMEMYFLIPVGIWFQNDVVALLFYVHGKHPRSCRDGQLT